MEVVPEYLPFWHMVVDWKKGQPLISVPQEGKTDRRYQTAVLVVYLGYDSPVWN
jgi:hypothetical protein